VCGCVCKGGGGAGASPAGGGVGCGCLGGVWGRGARLPMKPGRGQHVRDFGAWLRHVLLTAMLTAMSELHSAVIQC
jgi:hypothetical protein